MFGNPQLGVFICWICSGDSSQLSFLPGKILTRPILKLLLFLQDSQIFLAKSKTGISLAKGRLWVIGIIQWTFHCYHSQLRAKVRACDTWHRQPHQLVVSAFTLELRPSPWKLVSNAVFKLKKAIKLLRVGCDNEWDMLVACLVCRSCSVQNSLEPSPHWREILLACREGSNTQKWLNEQHLGSLVLSIGCFWQFLAHYVGFDGSQTSSLALKNCWAHQ